MKYLKNFNEELNPETYIKAGKYLKYYGKNKKGNKLIDWGYEKGHGFYDAHINIDNYRVRSGKITNPVCDFYYGINSSESIEKNMNEEELVTSWKNGESELGFSLQFYFTASEELKSLVPSEGRFNNKFNLFTICVILSHWRDGLEAYNYDEDNDILIGPDDPKYLNLIDLYNETKIIKISTDLIIPSGIYGIFANRKSALKFRRNLGELILPHKGKIMDLLSIIGSDDIEDIMDSFSKIRINALYQDENVKDGSHDLYKKWYTTLYKEFL